MSLIAEYEALSGHSGVIPATWSSLIRLEDEDRSRFLQGLVTCDVIRLEPGEGAYGFLTDAKGHILSDVVVRVLEERFWLEVPSSMTDGIAQHLGKYVVADRVVITPETGHGAVLVAGSGTTAMLASLLGEGNLPQGRWDHAETVVLGHPVVVAREHRFGIPSCTLWCQAEEVEGLLSEFSQTATVDTLQQVSAEALEIVRIEAGCPRFGRDFDSSNLPQETGLEEAVSFEKGCYLGQEVVARLQHRGQAARGLRSVRFSEAEPPVVGSVLVQDEREAGVVTSAARLPHSGAALGLAMLLRRAAASGTRLELDGGGEAIVV